MGKMLSGETPINADTYLEVENTLVDLAANAPGEVKTTAQFVLDELGGMEHSDSESSEQIDKFKDYCMDYTID
ncbi:hypothetical protein DXT87_14415 [Arthrobacter sp. AET 35A]|nr:hypothetical protein [Arthrobacter sp. AET 35A]